jgi:cellulose synthase (UDP-forming)
VPTYGEPYEILEKTIVHLKKLDYPADRLYILISDDSHRDEIRRLAELHQVHYNPGARKDAKAGNLNSALEYLDEHFPQATLILTQDADEIIASSFLKKTVGYFQDPKLAFVQTPKEAFTPRGDPFGNRDRIFYDILQPGRNGSGAAFSCGSGVIWRIAALKSIGGFVTWNLVEDLTTSYFLHSAGYRSEYHNEILTAGLSPDDIPGLLKQRGTWAADTWRFFLFNNPLHRPGLSLRQRLQYFELGMFYMASTLFTPALMLTPIL